MLSEYLTWTCLKMPGINSSRYLMCQTRKDPSSGWIVKSMSGLLFHSRMRVSSFRSSKTEGRGTLLLEPGEEALVLPSWSPSSCSEEPLSDISSRSKKNKTQKSTLYNILYICSKESERNNNATCKKKMKHSLQLLAHVSVIFKGIVHPKMKMLS